MRWVGRLVSSVAAVLLTTGGGLASTVNEGSAADDVAWADAAKRNTFEAYAHFALTYPDSKYSRWAQMKLAGADPGPIDGRGTTLGDDDAAASVPGLLPGSIMII